MTLPSATAAAAAAAAAAAEPPVEIHASFPPTDLDDQQQQPTEQPVEPLASAPKTRPDLSRALTVNLDAMAPVAPLVSVEIVCRYVSAEVLGVPDAVQLISDFADYARAPILTIPRACELRQLRLAKRIAAREASDASILPMDAYYRMLVFNTALLFAVDAVEDASNPDDEGMALVRWLCQDYCPQGYVTKALERAALQGKLGVIEWIVESHGRVIWRDTCANAAAGGGHVEALEWFLERGVLGSGWMNSPLADASREGHADVVQWLLTHGSTGFFGALNSAVASGHTTIAKQLVEHFGSGAVVPLTMRVAAENNQLEVFKWIQEQIPEAEGSPAIMDAAIENGHFAMVEWLEENRSDGRSRRSLDIAAANGHLDLVKWLHVHRNETCSVNAMNEAAANGHLEIVQWLHENRSEGCTTNAMDRAAGNGHLEVVKWLHENREEGCTFRAMNNAAQSGHSDMLVWLHEHRPEKATAMAMTVAASNGHLDVIKWLYETLGRGCTANAPVLAAEGGHVDVLEWLHETFPTLEWSTAVMDAASSLPVLRWLHDHRLDGCTTRALDDAAAWGLFDKALFLQEHYPSVGCSPEAATLAVQNDHIEMFMWLCENYPDEIEARLLEVSRPVHHWAQVFELFFPTPVEPAEQAEAEELPEPTGADVSTVPDTDTVEETPGAEGSETLIEATSDGVSGEGGERVDLPEETTNQAEPEAEAAVVLETPAKQEASEPLLQAERETLE